MEIHQIVVSASPGDAVTNAALGFQELLQRVGPSGVFARYIDPRLDGKVFPLSVYDACAHPDDLLIYHVSIGEPEVVQFLLGRRERLVLVYHNITPPEYFAALDPGLRRPAGLRPLGTGSCCGSGRCWRWRSRRTTPGSSRRSATTTCGSRRSRSTSARCTDSTPIRPRWPSSRRLDGPLVLFVGQLLPHKRPDLLLQAYHVADHVPDARGAPRPSRARRDWSGTAGRLQTLARR